jgi:phage shock protein C
MSIWDRWYWWNGPHRLYRDTERGMISGICAGLADYLGVKIVLVRVAAVLALCFLIFPVLVAYIVLTFVLPRKPLDGYTYRAAYRAEAGRDDRDERRADREERRAERYARRRARRQYRYERRYGPDMSTAPGPDMPPPTSESLRALLDKFGRLEDRLAHMETEVTSSDFELKRKFRDIGG